ncbi:protein phosphatase [Streptomyces sp. NPDC004111]|uniref:protein-tyrosine phosphatase family protein n=1 Tax=Streptomyces sp. NPDC004111 TaxID=3364690 RepID=UPI0036917B24
MKVRQQGNGPEPRAPWDEIVPGLWMGGHYWDGPAGEALPAVVHDEFDLVVSLFTRPGHGPSPDVEHLVGEIPDDPLNAEQLATVQELAEAVARAVRAGRVTLVRCSAGYNRSGLVVAQALVELGHVPAEAIGLVRRKRSAQALNNATFEGYLTAGLETARLLTDLDAPA